MKFLEIKYSGRLLLATILSGALLLAIGCGSDSAPAAAPYVAPTAVSAVAPTVAPASGPQKGGVLRFAARPLAELKTFDANPDLVSFT